MNVCRFVTLTACILLATRLTLADSSQARRPNIVLFVADDLGYAELGCYGQQRIKTPHIDRLARSGMRFTQFYAGNAVCAPSRCCLMTGKHPGHAYVRNNGDPRDLQHLREEFGWEFPGQHPLPAHELTLGEFLQQLGYATAAIGKWGLGHFGTTGDPNRQGFDLFYGFNCQRHAHNHYPRFLWRNGVKQPLAGNNRTLHGQTYSQDKFMEVGIEFIRHNQERPFFLYMPFAIPHLSIQVPNASLAPYNGLIVEEDYEHRGYLQHPTPRAGYAAMISHMDRGIGKVMEVLKELELHNNTLVMFTSDNGPTFDRLGGSDSQYFESAGQFRGLKGSLYEGGIRVPLVANWPQRIAAGTITSHLSAFWDLFPTIADIVEEPVASQLDGISFAPTLFGTGSQPQHEYLYWEFPGYGGQQAVRAGSWKAIRQNMLKKDNPTPLKIELYQLDEDIGEANDVSQHNPEVVKRMKRWMAEAHTVSELFPMPLLDAGP